MWGMTLGSSVTHHHTGLTPSPPIRYLYTPFLGKPILPHLPAPPRPHQQRVCLPVPTCPPCCCPSHSLWVSLHLSRPVCLCLVLCFSSPSTSLYSAVSTLLSPAMSPPLAGQQPLLAPPRSPSAQIFPASGPGNHIHRGGGAGKGSPSPGFGLTQARPAQVITAATGPTVWSREP